MQRASWTRRILGAVALGCAVVSGALTDQTAQAAEQNDRALCTAFVERLLADDYNLFFSLKQTIPGAGVHSCLDAHEEEPGNPAFMLGLARSMDLGAPFTSIGAERAVALLRQAAEQGYEPALVQLLRYRWQDRFLEDPFLNRIRSIGFSIDDDPLIYVDGLAGSESGRVQDLVLGSIVVNVLNERFDLAQTLAKAGIARNSPKAIYNWGMMHIGGYGVPRDNAQGFELLRQAARRGDFEAQVQLANLSAGADFSAPAGRHGEAIDLYRDLTAAAANGHEIAAVLLGKFIVDLVEREEARTSALQPVLLEVIACNIDDDLRLRLTFSEALQPLPDLDQVLPPCQTDAYRKRGQS